MKASLMFQVVFSDDVEVLFPYRPPRLLILVAGVLLVVLGFPSLPVLGNLLDDAGVAPGAEQTEQDGARQSECHHQRTDDSERKRNCVKQGKVTDRNSTNEPKFVFVLKEFLVTLTNKENQKRSGVLKPI